jgi:hypothetical protein
MEFRKFKVLGESEAIVFPKDLHARTHARTHVYMKKIVERECISLAITP